MKDVKKAKFVWRVVRGSEKKPYYVLNNKRYYIKNKENINNFRGSKQIKVRTTNLKSREW